MGSDSRRRASVAVAGLRPNSAQSAGKGSASRASSRARSYRHSSVPVGASSAMSPGARGRGGPSPRRIIRLPISRAHVSATMPASSSRMPSMRDCGIDVDLDLCDAGKAMLRFAACCFERDIASLLSAERGFKALVDVTEDVVARAEVRRDANDIPGELLLHGLAGLPVGLNVGAAEAVNSLLGIADHEKPSGEQAALVPEFGGLRSAGQEEDDFGLDGWPISSFPR
jgi:hypothetical protein